MRQKNLRGNSMFNRIFLIRHKEDIDMSDNTLQEFNKLIHTARKDVNICVIGNILCRDIISYHILFNNYINGY